MCVDGVVPYKHLKNEAKSFEKLLSYLFLTGAVTFSNSVPPSRKLAHSRGLLHLLAHPNPCKVGNTLDAIALLTRNDEQLSRELSNTLGAPFSPSSSRLRKSAFVSVRVCGKHQPDLSRVWNGKNDGAAGIREGCGGGSKVHL